MPIKLLRLSAAIALCLSFLSLFGPAAGASADSCQFVLGFATIHGQIPSIVGSCVDNVAYATNGDALQHTNNGLMAWRKLDNFTAFTDGYRTWVNGPNGIQERLNTQRFPWEADYKPGMEPAGSGSQGATDSSAAAPAAPSAVPTDGQIHLSDVQVVEDIITSPQQTPFGPETWHGPVWLKFMFSNGTGVKLPLTRYTLSVWLDCPGKAYNVQWAFLPGDVYGDITDLSLLAKYGWLLTIDPGATYSGAVLTGNIPGDISLQDCSLNMADDTSSTPGEEGLGPFSAAAAVQ